MEKFVLLTSFNQLGLSKPVLKAISALGFEKPSEIQEKAIPQLLTGDKDFIGLAQTGTGKTAAFGLPLMELIDPALPFTQALILAPTRELGQQIAGQLEKFGKYLDKTNILAVYGGAPIVNQIKALRKPQHIIIATPGRLLDLIRRKSVQLDMLQYLVLDEADEMLNMGFQEDIDTILSHASDDKRTWLFSATMSKEIRKIVQRYMDRPFEVRLNDKNEVNTNIEHRFAVVRHADKTEALTRFLDVDPQIRGVVFCRTRRDTQELSDMLNRKNYKADALHGDLSQKQRDHVMNRFKKHDLQLLVATDIAARGIDVNDLTHVFHFNLPDDDAYYTHRSGRTGRAGKKGTSIALVNGRDRNKINFLQKRLSIPIERIRIPSSADIYDTRVENWCLDVLNKPITGKIDPELLEKANLLFGNLSKEELIAKVLTYEMQKVKMESTRDLNKAPESNGDGGYRGNKKGGKTFRKHKHRPYKKKGGYKKKKY